MAGPRYMIAKGFINCPLTHMVQFTGCLSGHAFEEITSP